MPDTIWYSEQDQTLHIGVGEIAPVPPEVWHYRVNGMPVVEKWFRYRKRDPAGRRTSALDDIHAERWTAAVTGDLLDMLNVLGRCVALHPQQADLLEQICAGPQVTRADLSNAGVLPVPDRSKKPPRPGTPSAPKLF
jgi:hypothetical protein